LESEKQLTTAKERRDNLTKHLHTIIISNESRKANKLQQLMSTLHDESGGMATEANDDKSNTNNCNEINHTTVKSNNVLNQYSGPL